MSASLLASMALAVGLGSPAAETLSDKLDRLEARYRECLVRVRYTQQVSISTAEPPQEEELATGGLVVGPDGVVMVSGIVYEPFNEVPQGLGVRFPASVTRTEARVSEARVRFVDGREYPAELLGPDSKADVAFLSFKAEGRRIRPVAFGSPPLPAIGEQVAVLSLLPDSLGGGLAVELSRVQALVSKPSEGFLVSTSAADPVGGLVTDLDGNPLGMLDALTVPVPETRPRTPLAILSIIRGLPGGIGRGFVRPAHRFAAAASRPPRSAPPRRGWLGVEMQALTPELAAHLGLPQKSGIVLAYVYRRSPAERAGLRTGDILVDLEGESIEVSREEELGRFSEKVLRAGAGAELRIGYLREGVRQETVSAIGPAPKTVQQAETLKIEALDLTVREVTFDYLATRNLDPDKKGVVVEKPPVAVRTNPNRLMREDLLIKIGERPVADLASFREALELLQQERPDEVVLFVERGRESFFFAIKPEWK